MEIENPTRVLSFWEKVEKLGINECWNWIGAKDTEGYGNFTVQKGKTAKAHRFSFKLAFGWILDNPYQIDHKCNNPSCVNPKHLCLLLGKENNEKSNSSSAINKRKTHCIRGHHFSDENTIKRNGRRICIACEKYRGRM